MRHMLMLLAAIAAATPVLAAERETVNATVSMKDLNLASRDGQRAATRRVKRAAIALCGALAETRDLGRMADIKRCQSEALASGMAATARAIAAAGAAPQVALR